MRTYLDFEKPIAEVDARLTEARDAVAAGRVKMASEVTRLEARLDRIIAQTFRKLSPWQRVQLARHPDRPSPILFAQGLAEDVIRLDPGAVTAPDPTLGHAFTALARLGGFSALVVAADRPGVAPAMPWPRLIGLAERWRLPLVPFVATGDGTGVVAPPDTAARDLQAVLASSAVVVAVITGAVNGLHALAVTAADHVLMLDYAVWSVVSPEAAAAGLWQDDGQTKHAAESLRLTAAELQGLGLVDTVIAEPAGGAHRQPAAAMTAVRAALATALTGLLDLPPAALRRRRLERIRRATAPGAGG